MKTVQIPRLENLLEEQLPRRVTQATCRLSHEQKNKTAVMLRFGSSWDST